MSTISCEAEHTIQNETPLLQRAAGGDVDAFGELLAHHETSALRLATVILGTSIGANDVVQDASIRAWTARTSIDPDRNFRNWYLRIVANTAKNRLRSYWRRSALELRYTAAASEAPESRDPALQTIAAEERAVVIAALNRLGRNDRTVIALRYFEQLSEAEMAEVVGCSPGTIKSRLSRALARLRRELNGGVLRGGVADGSVNQGRGSVE